MPLLGNFLPPINHLAPVQFLFNRKLLDSFTQGSTGNTEELGGLDLITVGFLEGVYDELAFDSRDDF